MGHVRVPYEIYKAARRVSVWLRKPDRDKEEAATTLAHFYGGYVDNVRITHIPSTEGNKVHWDHGRDGILETAEY